MRTIRNAMIAAGLSAVVVSAVAFGSTAQADPPSGTVPAHLDMVAVGAQTDDLLFDSLSTDYDSTVTPTASHLYSYDATNPTTGATDTISTKTGCAAVTRPNGANAGITALEANARPSGDRTDYCIDIARGSRPRASTDPSSILFIPFAIDAVSWASDRQPGKPTNAPTSLSTLDLTAIYSCDASILGTGKTGPVTWNEVGGHGAHKVVPVIPPSTAATRSFFLSEIGVTTLGSCVLGQDNSVEQNEGTNPIFTALNSPDIVFPYSTAVYLAQTVHNHGAGDQGYEFPGLVDGIRSTVGSGANEKINVNFEFLRNIFNVVRNASTTGGQAVPTYLVRIVGNGKGGNGYICSSATANADITSYGFLFDRTDCGLLE